MHNPHHSYTVTQKKAHTSRSHRKALAAHLILLSMYNFSAHPPINRHSATLSQRKEMYAAIRTGDLITVQQLLTDGYHPDGGCVFGNVPLINAAVLNKKEIAIELIAHDANLNWHNEFGITPFLAAIMFKNVTIAQLLLQHGAQPLLEEKLTQTINTIRSYYARCHANPADIQQSIRIHLSNQASPHYALTRCDLIYLQANSIPHTPIETTDSTEKRFKQYMQDIELVLKKEFFRMHTTLTTLAEIVPQAPFDLLYLILSFESAFPLRYMHRLKSA